MYNSWFIIAVMLILMKLSEIFQGLGSIVEIWWEEEIERNFKFEKWGSKNFSRSFQTKFIYNCFIIKTFNLKNMSISFSTSQSSIRCRCCLIVKLKLVIFEFFFPLICTCFPLPLRSKQVTFTHSNGNQSRAKEEAVKSKITWLNG